MQNSSPQAMPQHRNGVDLVALTETIAAIGDDPTLARFRFRTGNQWLHGGHNRSRVQAFFGCGGEDRQRTEPFVLDNDEPPLLLGNDAAPNPVEYVLHALAGCLTTSLVYHAAARGIDIGAVDTELEGELDLRGFLGLDALVPKGYQRIDVRLRVQSRASADTVEALIGHSPVYDMLSRALPVNVRIETC